MNRQFKVTEHVRNSWKAGRSFVFLKVNKKKKIMNKKFKEALMLAVTQVNGCKLCSYVHTKVALSAGCTESQIRELLEGETANVQKEHLEAVLFAQHFADENENPSAELYFKIEKLYGVDQSQAIVAVLYIITMTNAMGISMDAFWNRIKFNRDSGSYLFREIMIPLLTIFLFPISVLFHYIKCTFKRLEIKPKLTIK
jgi:AhpD family alkylhydroperoxidase